MVLGDQAPSDQTLENLTKALLEKTLKQQRVLLHSNEDSERGNTFIFLALPLSQIYKTGHEVKQDRISMDSELVQSAEKLAQTLLEIIIPKIAESVYCGDFKSIQRLAASMEFAQCLAAQGGETEQGSRNEESIDKLTNTIWGKKGKHQERTRRLRMLLPLWLLGFGRLSYVQQSRAFLEMGLSEAEIPEEDTLRKFLSYYRIPSLLISLGLK